MQRLLVVVDYQNDFVDGALGFEGADKIAPRIVELIKEFRANKDTVVFTYDTHQEDYLKTTEGQYLPAPHCLKGTKGWELHPSIKDLVEDSLVFEKPGDICVFSNAIIAKAAASTYCKIKIVRDATSSFDLEMQEKAFDVLKHLHMEII